MTDAVTVSQRLSQDTRYNLIEIIYDNAATPLRYHNSDVQPNNVTYNSSVYYPRKFRLSNFQVRSGGTLPRPKLSIDNIDGTFYSLLENNSNFRGATVVYREIYQDNLDGEGDPDATQLITNLTYVVTQFIRLNREQVEFQLKTRMDVEYVLSHRQMMRNICARPYRVPDTNNADTFFAPTASNACPYNGSNYFKTDNTSTATWTEDACSKQHEACVLRFGQTSNLPFQGAPSIGRRS